eukprot:97484_1
MSSLHLMLYGVVIFLTMKRAYCNFKCSNTDSILEQIGAQVSGEFYVNADGDAYTEASIQWAYPAFGPQTIHPSIIIYPQSDDDIFTLLQLARECDYNVVIRSGGHQYNALSSCNSNTHACIQIDMKHYNNIDLSPANKTLTVEPGVQLRQFAAYLDAHHYFLPWGKDLGIGIGGHILTGGNGYLTKSHGLLGDYVTAFDIILSNGTTLQHIASPHDLYWAVLGGSPGSYGIITKYELDVSHTDNAHCPHSTGFVYAFQWDKQLMFTLAHLFIQIHQDTTHYVRNDNVGSFVFKFAYNADINDYMIQISWIWVGSHAEGKNYLSQLFINAAKELSIDPFMSKEIEAPMSTLLMEMAEQKGHIAPMAYMMRTHGTRRNLDEEFVDLLVDRIELVTKKYGVYKRSGMLLTFWFESYAKGAGYKNDPRMTKTSYPYRKQWIVFPICMFYNENMHKKSGKMTKKWLEDTMEILMLTKPFGYGKDDYRHISWTFGNVNMAEVWQYYYPNQSAFHKLQDIKLQYDPIDLFHTTFTIPLPVVGTDGDKKDL